MFYYFLIPVREGDCPGFPKYRLHTDKVIDKLLRIPYVILLLNHQWIIYIIKQMHVSCSCKVCWSTVTQFKVFSLVVVLTNATLQLWLKL